MGIFSSKSEWLAAEQDKHPGTQSCPSCQGTGSTGGINERGETIACPDCGGFGY